MSFLFSPWGREWQTSEELWEKRCSVADNKAQDIEKLLSYKQSAQRISAPNIESSMGFSHLWLLSFHLSYKTEVVQKHCRYWSPRSSFVTYASRLSRKRFWELRKQKKSRQNTLSQYDFSQHTLPQLLDSVPPDSNTESSGSTEFIKFHQTPSQYHSMDRIQISASHCTCFSLRVMHFRCMFPFRTVIFPESSPMGQMSGAASSLLLTDHTDQSLQHGRLLPGKTVSLWRSKQRLWTSLRTDHHRVKLSMCYFLGANTMLKRRLATFVSAH